ncbi:hypothetical protein GF324_06105 [bacterium]|nr:hypothetical protein [bacterium]
MPVCLSTGIRSKAALYPNTGALVLPSGGEIILVLLAVLIFFGAKDLPRIVRTMGQWSATLRRAMNDVRSEFNAIAIEEELRKTREMVEKNYPSASQQDTKESSDTPDSGVSEEGEADVRYPEESNRTADTPEESTGDETPPKPE